MNRISFYTYFITCKKINNILSKKNKIKMKKFKYLLDFFSEINLHYVKKSLTFEQFFKISFQIKLLSKCEVNTSSR